jgi:hypothetical protein
LYKGMSARKLIPVRLAHPSILAASLLVSACAAFGCSAPPGDVNSPYDPEELDEGAGGGDPGGAESDGGAGGDTGTGSGSPTRCGSDQTVCAGACVDLETDAQNCGACGDPCALGASCEDGTCGG